MGGLTLELQPEPYALCRFAPGAAAELAPGAFGSVTRTAQETSVVCAESAVPAGAEHVDGGWRLLRIAGTQDLALTGVLAQITTPLARARVPIFTIATYDTDWFLVPGARLQDGLAALSAADHLIR